ncbi:hypothetical protein B9P78_07310 [Aerococcus sp. 1KP-2016]|nr:hypothetical protein B9P78_07310 [Aerococcus sp. 1KP-2016]
MYLSFIWEEKDFRRKVCLVEVLGQTCLNARASSFIGYAYIIGDTFEESMKVLTKVVMKLFYKYYDLLK